MSYDEVALGELLTPWPRKEEVKLGYSYRIAGIYSFGKGMLDRGSRQGSDMAYRLLTRLKAGQVVFARLNAWEGALAVVPANFDGTYVSNEYPTFDVRTEIIDTSYMQYLLKWSRLWEQLAPRGSMVRRKRTTESVFLATSVPLPSINEQRRIVAKLDGALGDLPPAIELSASVCSRLGRSLLSACFPVKHSTAKLAELIELERVPVHVDPDAIYTQIGIRSFGRGVFHRSPMPGSRLSKLSYFEVEPKRLFFSNIMAWEGAVAVTQESDKGFVASQRFLGYRAKSGDVDLGYLGYFFRTERGMNLVREGSTGSVKRNQTLSPRTIDRFEVPLPPIAEQRRVVAMLNYYDQKICTMVSHRDRLAAALQPALLNAAFSGQL